MKSSMYSAQMAPRRLSDELHPLPQVGLCRRGELRVEKFLDAATEVFAEKGFQHAKLSEIVAKAGGSLATLYRAFGDKEGLAYAILDRRMHKMAEALSDLRLDNLPPEIGLRKAAEQYMDRMTSEEAQLVHRLVIGEGRTFPGLRDWFFRTAVVSLTGDLSRYLQLQADQGRLSLHGSADFAAAQFFTLLFGDLMLRTASGYLPRPDEDEIERYVSQAVALFLHGSLPR